MAGDRYPSFNDMSSLLAYLNALPAVHDVRGFSVDMQSGKITAPVEFRNGNIIEIYSEEVIKRFQEILETALVLRIQLFLLEKLAALPENNQMASYINSRLPAVESVTPQDVLPILITLQRKEGTRSLAFFKAKAESFGAVGKVVNEVLSQHNLKSINSLSAVDDILKQIDEKIQAMKVSPDSLRR